MRELIPMVKESVKIKYEICRDLQRRLLPDNYIALPLKFGYIPQKALKKY